ncbi:MAG: FMN-binding negative transcriptional regulator [Fibrobacteres bacterium]|nr:FMN-binding negative transcriptional regulator [Fibrobacterota bacterium]
MYNPSAFTESDPVVLLEFIDRNPFATVVTASENEPKVSHIPMYYAETDGKRFLVGHFARANDHWRNLNGKTTAIFHGPHAYISSKWYATENTVPTWNYVTVHASGRLSVVDEKELHSIIDLMIRRHEGDIRSFQAGLSEEARGHLEKQIVGVKMEIETLEGKWKVSQNKSLEIQRKIIGKLTEAGDWNSAQVAMIMAKRMAGNGNPGT